MHNLNAAKRQEMIILALAQPFKTVIISFFLFSTLISALFLFMIARPTTKLDIFPAFDVNMRGFVIICIGNAFSSMASRKVGDASSGNQTV